MRATALTVAALLSVGAGANETHAAPPAHFEGRLAAVPCANHGDIEISNASVELAESVTCVAHPSALDDCADASGRVGGAPLTRPLGDPRAAW